MLIASIFIRKIFNAQYI